MTSGWQSHVLSVFAHPAELPRDEASSCLRPRAEDWKSQANFLNLSFSVYMLCIIGTSIHAGIVGNVRNYCPCMELMRVCCGLELKSRPPQKKYSGVSTAQLNHLQSSDFSWGLQFIHSPQIFVSCTTLTTHLGKVNPSTGYVIIDSRAKLELWWK